MLQQSVPEDYVIATGETHSVKEFVEAAFEYVGRTIKWEGQGLNEVGIDVKSGDVLVRVDPKHFRPTEVVIIFNFSFYYDILFFYYHKKIISKLN